MPPVRLLKRCLRSRSAFLKGCVFLLLCLCILVTFPVIWPRDYNAGYHLVLWYNPSKYVINRPDALSKTFEGCGQSRCRLTFDRKEAPFSQTVIFDGRQIESVYQPFQRPAGQLWVWWGNEAPSKYYETGTGWSALPFANSFNLTMTYHRNSDIVMPYGAIVEKTSVASKDFFEVVARKQKSVLWIASNCHTFSWREEYVKELRKYISVDILGECGDSFKPWQCGTRHVHDDCFKILNEYFFFLAFENALCEDYFTEKVFENYEHDTILVIRGGLKSNLKTILPDDTYIDVSDFDSPKQLGSYLSDLLVDNRRYIQMLEEKHRYESVPFQVLYQRALCQLCEHVTSHTSRATSSIKNLRDYFHERNFCQLPTDIASKRSISHRN